MPGEKESNTVSVLLVDDDEGVYDVIRQALTGPAFRLDWSSNLTDARHWLASRHTDVLVLDLGLPDGDGLTLARQLREAQTPLPILMLTTRGSIDDRLEGFDYGADDYLCKPFAVEELVARINAILRRTRSSTSNILRYEDIELDLMKRIVHRRKLEAELSIREVELLAFFLRHPQQVITRSRLLEEVWGFSSDESSNVINVYVNYLRNKLERGGLYPRVIHTVRGIGYMLSDVEPDEIQT